MHQSLDERLCQAIKDRDWDTNAKVMTNRLFITM